MVFPFFFKKPAIVVFLRDFPLIYHDKQLPSRMKNAYLQACFQEKKSQWQTNHRKTRLQFELWQTVSCLNRTLMWKGFILKKKVCKSLSGFKQFISKFLANRKGRNRCEETLFWITGWNSWTVNTAETEHLLFRHASQSVVWKTILVTHHQLLTSLLFAVPWVLT